MSVTGPRNHPVMTEPIAPIARRQHGLVTRTQALSVLTAHQVRHRLRTGRLEAVRPGVYRVGGSPESWVQAVLGACLAVTGSVASFRCAAALWGLEGFAPGDIEITVPARSRRRLEGVVVHDSAVGGPLHCASVAMVPVTSVARTLCDLSAVAPPWSVERAVDDSLRRKLVKLPTLQRVAADLEGRGRLRCTVTRGILERRVTGTEPGESAAEGRLARLLVGAGLPRPVHQHRVRLGGRTVRVDLAYPEAMVAIEYDGWDFHRTRRAFDLDRARANELELLGWTVLRFTSQSGDQLVVDTVRAALRRACVG